MRSDEKKASLRVPREAVGLPYRKHKERQARVRFLCKCRPVEISYVSLGDRFAAQIVFGGFLPALSFYPPSPRLWRTILFMGFVLSFAVYDLEMVLEPRQDIWDIGLVKR